MSTSGGDDVRSNKLAEGDDAQLLPHPNKLEVAASLEWPSFYPGVERVHLLDGRESLRVGMRFEIGLLLTSN